MDFTNYYNSTRCVELLVSEKYKFVYFIISKNGCSSILSSILFYDFGVYCDEMESNSKIWDGSLWYCFPIKKELTIAEAKIEINEYINKGYTLFTTKRDPFERFISLINHIHSLYNEYASYGIEDNVDSIVNNYELYATTDFHAIPQDIYINLYKNITNNKINIIDINDLSDYYYSLTKNVLLKNNVRKETDKIAKKDALTQEQLNKINDIIQKYNF